MSEPPSLSQPASFSPSGPPETVLPDPDPVLVANLELAAGSSAPREAVAAIVTHHPADSLAWATLGDVEDSLIVRYAAYRVGYHRGLDALRQNGWRGAGLVRFEHPGNRGFLRCVKGLADMANAIGETSEVDRCGLFLAQLDPAWIASQG
jgi:hypothetical protein